MIKTLRQYSSRTIDAADMERLKAVAVDYRIVRQYVYDRYSGINSVSKLYPGYTIQNEMTACGLRKKLKMPSVYYYLAIYDALGDIKSGWSRVIGRILKNISANENLTPGERHYLRYTLKMDQYYYAILQHKEDKFNSIYPMPEELLKIKPELDISKLNNYLRRQTRRHLKKPHTKSRDSFHISERAYRYADGGIYISTKENRKRVFVPLTDNNKYTKQLLVRLNVERRNIIIDVPTEVNKKLHKDYQNTIGLSPGYHTMYTSSSGNKYGEKLGEYSREEADWIREQNKKRSRIYQSVYHKNEKETGTLVNPAAKEAIVLKNNLGKKKYHNRKRRYDERLRSYINQEINRLLREERPLVVFLPRLPKQMTPTRNPQLNNSLSLWRRGYIEKRLRQKCEENGIEIVEVFGKDISRLCSVCGYNLVEITKGGGEVIFEKETFQENDKYAGIFICGCCGMKMDEKVNTANNILNRGRSEDGR